MPFSFDWPFVLRNCWITVCHRIYSRTFMTFRKGCVSWSLSAWEENTTTVLRSPSLAPPATFLGWGIKISPHSFSCSESCQLHLHALLNEVQPQDIDAKTLLLFIWCCKYLHFITLPIIFALITFYASSTLSLDSVPSRTPEASETLASQR